MTEHNNDRRPLLLWNAIEHLYLLAKYRTLPRYIIMIDVFFHTRIHFPRHLFNPSHVYSLLAPALS